MRVRILLAIVAIVVVAVIAPRAIRRARLNLALIGCMKELSHGSRPCELPAGDTSGRSLYHRGMNALRSNDPRTAIADFESLVRENPRDELAGYFLGEAYRAAGNEPAALTAWRRAGSVTVFRNRAWWHGSLTDFETAIEIGGVDAPTYYRFGDALFERGDLKRAREMYASGLKTDRAPEGAPALGANGRLAEIDGDWQRAASLYERALQLDPNDSTTYYRLATILSRHLHQPQKALAWCERSIEKTRAMTGYLCAADVSRDARDYDAALQWASRGEARFPKQSEIFISKGRTHEAAGDWKAADADYMTAGTIEPGNFWIPYYRAQLARKSGDSERAIAQLRRSLALNPTSPHLYLELGDEYREVGNIEGAASSFRNVLRLDPQNIAATQALNALAHKTQLQSTH